MTSRTSVRSSVSPLATGLLQVLVAVLLAVGVGCGGGGGDRRFAGTLEVANGPFSGDVLVGLDVDQVDGPDSYTFDPGLFPGESFYGDFYPTRYDVTVYWEDGTVDFYTVDVFNDGTTYLEVSN